MFSSAVKNQMIEKKLILCGILAIAIGIATIVPLEYMMAAQAQEIPLQDKPWFNLNIPMPTALQTPPATKTER